MKKLLLIVLATITLPLTAIAADGDVFTADVDDVEMTFKIISEAAKTCQVGDDSYSVACIKRSYSGSLSIPSSVNDYTVTSIGEYAFWQCSGLTSVTIPESVTSIGSFAFSGCSGLTSMTIPNSVTSIGRDAFQNCSGLTSLTIGNSVTSIGMGTFYHCSGLTSVNIPNSVTSIGISAFSGCSRLTSVTIPNSVTSIEGAAFYNCSSLTSVTIPESVTSIGSFAFSGCSGLTSVTIPNSVTTIDYATFSGCSGLTSVSIPASVTSIYESAFEKCTSLTSVTIPNSVTTIGDSFKGCSGLTSLTIEDGVQTLSFLTIAEGSEYAALTPFSGCPIESLYLGRNLSYSSSYSPFKDNKSLTLLTIGNSVTSIGEDAFRGCSGLTSVAIPNSVTSIGKYAFDGCDIVYLGDNIRSISGWYTFKNSAKLYANPGTVTVLALWNAGYSAYNKDTKKIIGQPYLSLDGRTQTTITLKIENYNDKYKYRERYDSRYFTGDVLRKEGLYPEQSLTIRLEVNLDGVNYYPPTSNFSTLSINPTIKATQVTASSLLVGGSYIKGDAEVVSQTIQVAGINQEGNEMTVTGLEPGKTYDASYAITVRYGAGGEYTYQYNGTGSFTTDALVLKNLTPKNVRVGEAVVCAETNISDAETNVGFEWRKVDAPETVPSKQGTAIIYDGVMEGLIKNLQTTSYYNIRPYYQSAAGNMYYGEWIGIDPSDYSYFEPTVHTYASVAVADGAAVLTGYVMDGSDDIIERGFEYWVSGSDAKSRVKAEAPSDVQTVVASGQKMTATLNGLQSETTYTCRAYAKTSTETFYGEEVSFTTPVATGIEDMPINNEQLLSIHKVYDLQGRCVGTSLEGLPRGIYIQNGRKFWVK